MPSEKKKKYCTFLIRKIDRIRIAGYYPNIMGSNFLLVSIAGRPKNLSDFIPDNGLASLAATLSEEKNRVVILDLNSPSLFSLLFSPAIEANLEQIAKKIFLNKEKPSLLDIFVLKKIDLAIAKRIPHLCADLEEKIAKIIETEDIDVIGFKLWAGEGFSWLSQIGTNLKKRFPALLFFGGGPQVDIFEHLIFRNLPFLDGLCYGEGEETIRELAKYVQNGRDPSSIPNMIWKEGTSYRKNEKKIISSLDSLPFPLYDPEIYRNIESKIKMVVIDESRGCPNHCFFCIHPVKSGKRKEKSPERVVKEMMQSKERHNIRLFRYAGSSTPPNLLEKIAIRLIEEKADLRYACFGSVKEFAGKEIFPLLKRSGCEALFFGIESASEEILKKAMNRTISVSAMESVLASCKKAGIFTVASIIYPAPFETESTREKTLDFLTRTRPDSALIQFPGVYPNTRWFHTPEEFGFSLNKKKYPLQVMNYQFKALFPPRYWKALPYRVNGMPFKKYAAETEAFQHDVHNLGILTSVSDETYLLYRHSGEASLNTFLDKNRYAFYAGQRELLEEEICTINAAKTP